MAVSATLNADTEIHELEYSHPKSDGLSTKSPRGFVAYRTPFQDQVTTYIENAEYWIAIHKRKPIELSLWSCLIAHEFVEDKL